jgi:hypothetical protein
VGDDSHAGFGKKNYIVNKGSVRRCVVVIQQLVLVSRVRGKVFALCGIGCLACQDELIVSNALNIKAKHEHALCSSPVSPFFVYGSCFLPRTLVLGLCRTFPEICIKSYTHSHFFRRIHHEIASGQIHDFK